MSYPILLGCWVCMFNTQKVPPLRLCDLNSIVPNKTPLHAKFKVFSFIGVHFTAHPCLRILTLLPPFVILFTISLGKVSRLWPIFTINSSTIHGGRGPQKKKGWNSLFSLLFLTLPLWQLYHFRLFIISILNIKQFDIIAHQYKYDSWKLPNRMLPTIFPAMTLESYLCGSI